MWDYDVDISDLMDDLSYYYRPKPCYVGDSTAPGSVLLDVWGPAEREAVKAKGAKYDPRVKKWFVPSTQSNIEERFHDWLPEVSRERRQRERKEHKLDPIAEKAREHPGRVYLAGREQCARHPPQAQWDPRFPGGTGCWFLPPELTADLAPWQQWLPDGVQAAGPSVAEADADVTQVQDGPGGLPLNTFKWVYFQDGDRLIRRQRRWAQPEVQHNQRYVEKVTQQEYNRRVHSAAWPNYKMQYEEREGPEEHGGGTLIKPDFIIDRRKQLTYRTGDLRKEEGEWWRDYEDPDKVARKRGQYKDRDEVVRGPPGSTPKSTGKRKRQRTAAQDSAEPATPKRARKAAPKRSKRSTQRRASSDFDSPPPLPASTQEALAAARAPHSQDQVAATANPGRAAQLTTAAPARDVSTQQPEGLRRSRRQRGEAPA